MLRNCLYCSQPYSDGPNQWSLRPGVRIAFDPERGRLWTVCDSCHGWSLWLLDDRLDALEKLESAAGRARILHQTENVALLEAGERELIRVGRTGRQEEAWWRYGRQLRRRRDRYDSRLTLVGAATYAAVSYVGANLGFSRLTGTFSHDEDIFADVLRWRRFGSTAWSGRVPCPRCQSVLIKLFFFNSQFLILLPGQEQGIALGMPCSRCDPWTVDKVHRFDGAAAERVLRRVLAYRNIRGALPAELTEAVQVIDDAGSARGLIEALAAKRASLFGLGRTHGLALEISINEAVEREQLALEGSMLESAWRRAEEIAAIIDEELS